MSRYIAALALLVAFYLLGIMDCQIIDDCPPNEIFKSCGTACEPQCNLTQPETCIDLCIENVCQCMDGFARNDTGFCVVFSDCISL